jgi:hypothetical protein
VIPSGVAPAVVVFDFDPVGVVLGFAVRWQIAAVAAVIFATLLLAGALALVVGLTLVAPPAFAAGPAPDPRPITAAWLVIPPRSVSTPTHSRNAASNACGFNARNTRLIVSCDGMPCSSRRCRRSQSSFWQPNSSMSSQPSAPAITAQIERQMISTSVCFRVRSIRGSFKPPKCTTIDNARRDMCNASMNGKS